MFGNVFQNKRIFLTGHTGFKGSWLAEWLLDLGAEVFGYALEPDTDPALFQLLGLENRLHHKVGDIRNGSELKRSLADTKPDFVFHLAAQPLVRLSYSRPVETFETNINGTIHVLEALRHLDNTCVGIFVTTDKVYENREEGLPFTEADRLGGRDPYSASKAMAELAITAYTKSFFDSSDCRVKISSVRAGNVIGGGDWALDRILPDCIRALQKNESIQIRNPNATRPWQHVLEPLSGYLWLAYELATNSGVPHALNFGPPPDCNRPVRDVVTEVLRNWPGTWTDHSSPNALHEARLLSLSIDKAVGRGWMPVWNFEETIRQTVEWYRSVSLDPLRSREITLAQIKAYATHASFAGLRWAKE